MNAPVIGNEKPPELNLEQILAKANRRLPHELKVRSDDPLLSVLAINEELLNAYLGAVKQALRETQLETETHTRQLNQHTEEQAARLLAHAGEQMEAHIRKAGEAWEKRFKAMSEVELFKIRAAALYAQIGGALVLVVGSLAAGLMIGNWLFP
jgi:hypothetical protein